MGQMTIKDRVVLFDDADAALLAEWQWHLHLTPTVTYARGYPKGNRGAGLTYMHRLLTEAARGEDVDHISGDGLDNRRRNLRQCSRSQNNANRHRTASATGVKGVHFEAWSGRWRAEIERGGRRYKLGRYDTQGEAAAAYAAKATELFGEYAHAFTGGASSK
jgi:hypothetical protein